MSGDESFLMRWSRRKRDALAPSNGEKHLPQQAVEIGKPVSASTAAADPSMPLLPIEAIGSASDIREFLAPGVPLALMRAALRRAWTIDPAIREFIGLSENSWDFNAPDGVPGFGSLALQGAHRLAAQLLKDTQKPEPSAVISLAEDASRHPEAATAIVALRENSSSAQNENEDASPYQTRTRSRHGSALPQ